MSTPPPRANDHVNPWRLALPTAAPALFVLLWSTGFIGAKWGLPHAAPLSFLSVRYALVILIMGLLSLVYRRPYPRQLHQWAHWGVAGLLIHGVYLAGVFTAIHLGLPAGMAALIVGLQPIFTALGAGYFLGERVYAKQWWGLMLGLIGVALVVSGKWGQGLTFGACISAIIALCAITSGTLYQKKFCAHVDWRSGAVMQFLPSAVLTTLGAWLIEDFAIHWNVEFIGALMWLVLVLSIGAISLLNFLIRQGSSVNVARLFYLTPVSTALIAWLAFNETMTPLMLTGMAIAIGGVVLSRQR